MTEKVKIKDRQTHITAVKIALNFVDITVNYPTAELIDIVIKEVQTKGKDFSIRDASKLHVAWEQKWDKYFDDDKKD